jgi:hypothetical protein
MLRLISKLLSPISVLLFLVSSGAGVSAQTQKTDVFPVCAALPFKAVFRYHFSPTFELDHTVFAFAIGAGEEEWGLHRSADGGISWRLIRGEWLGRLAFSPNYAADSTIFATGLSGVARSTDRGVTWEPLRGAPITRPDIGSQSPLAAADANTVFLGAGTAPESNDLRTRGLFRITVEPNSATWEQLTSYSVNAIALSPDFGADRTLFIGEHTYKINLGLRKSVDGGKTWKYSSLGIDLGQGIKGPGTTNVLFSPNYPRDETLFAQTVSRYYRSTDRGVTWQRVDPLNEWNEPSYFVPSWILSPDFASDQTAWIDFGTWVTRDAGATWKWLGLTEYMDVTARKWCEGDRCGVLLLGGSGWLTPAGVYKSFDLGRTWRCADAPTPAWWPDIPPLVPTWLPVIFK